MLTGKPVVLEPTLPQSAGGAPEYARIEVRAQRHDAERYQLDFSVRLGPQPTEGQDAPSTAQVPSAMLVRPGELRLCSTARGDRAVFALLRLKR